MRRALVLVVAVACSARSTPVLRPDSPIERDIGAGEVHRYEVELAARTVLLGTVDQLGVDVVVTTFDPAGRPIAEVDSPIGDRGGEHITIDAATAGRYRIEVRAFADARGTYRVRIDEIVPRSVIAERAATRAKAIDAYFAARSAFVTSFLAWAKAHATEDLAGFDRVIGDAPVVTLAEADHGIHEYLAQRNAIVRHLVADRGFTAYVIETGFAEGLAVDAYVRGASTLSSREAAGLAFAWGIAAPMQENVELLDWLRAHNAALATRRKVRVYGMDLTGGRSGLFVESRRALEAVLEYIATANPARHRVHLSRLAPLLPLFDTAHYLDATPAQRSELTSAVSALAADAAGDPIAARHAFVAVELERFFRETRSASTKRELADPSSLGIRDAAMASNVLWALDREGPEGRLVVFTHNAHARRGPILWWPLTLSTVTAMGEHLSRQLGDRLVVIGAAHADGPSETFDYLLHQVGIPQFLVDLRRAVAEGALRAGLVERWDLLNLGLQPFASRPVWTIVPAGFFDAVVYTDHVTPARTVP